jgi:Tfp pilus assembly protein PilO
MAANEWNEKTRMIVTISIGIAANIVLGVLFYFAYSKHGELTKQLKAKQGEKASLQKTAETLPLKVKTLNDLQAEFEINKKKLPDTEAVANLYNDITPISQRNKGLITQFRFATVVDAAAAGAGPGSNLKKITINTKWESPFWGLLLTLNEIEEKFPRFVAIDNLTITPKASGVVITGMPLDISADIITYTYKESTTP